MAMRRTCRLLSVALVAACGGGSNAPVVVVDAPTAAMNKLSGEMAKFATLVANVEANLVFMLDPSSSQAQGLSFAPDPGKPNAVTLSGSLDGNGDGFRESTLSGGLAFGSDPDVDWTGLDAQLRIDVDIPIVGHIYRSDLAVTITADDERRISGSGSFSAPMSTTTTSMRTPAGAQLRVRPATGPVSNACAYDLDGRVELDSTGPTGRLQSTWSFTPGRAVASVSAATFTDGAGNVSAMPDATVAIGCGATVTMAEWAAVYVKDWACLPRESGRERVTVRADAADRVAVVMEEISGAGGAPISYTATVVGAGGRAVRGFFIDGPAGFRYREDFTWTLGQGGARFSSVSTYVYIEGPWAGRKGVCVGSARRQP
jgi:FAD/FMN-containing dehydrogenase